MNGFVAGAIVGKLMLDKTKWSQSINEVKGDETKMTGMSGRMGAGFTKMGMAMTVAGGAIVGALGLMVKKFVTAGDEVHKMALRTGFATETLSELKYAAEISGTNISSLEKGVKKMSKTIIDASDGLTTYQRAFERIGVSYEALLDLKPEEQFLTLADAIASVEDPTIRAAAAQDIFGRAGTQLLPLFSAGVEGMEALRQKARDLGIVFDQEAAEKAARLADAQTTLKASMQGLTMAIAEHIVPILSKFAEGLAGIISKYSAWAKAHPGLAGALTKAVALLGGMLTVLGPILIILPKLVAGIVMLKGAFIALAGPIGLAVAALGALTIGYLKVKAAQDQYLASSRAAAEAEDRLVAKLKKAADQAGLTEKEFLKLRDAYNGNAAAMAMAIKQGKEGEKLQTALRDVSKEHKEEIEKQKDAYEDSIPALDAYDTALTGISEKMKTWVDYLKDVGIQTIQEKAQRVSELEGILKGLEQAYKDGKITLEDYIKAVKSAHDELDDLVPGQTLQAGRDLGDILGKVQTDLQQTSYWASLAGDKLTEDFARASGKSVWELRQEIYNLSQAVMSFAGVSMPSLVISNKAAWPQIQTDVKETESVFTEVSQRIKDQWTTGLAGMLEGSRSFKDVMGGIWGTIKKQFFTLVAQMITKWTIGLIGGILTGSGGLLDGVKSIFGGIGNALTGSAEGAGTGGLFGNMGGSFLSSIAKMAGPIGIGLLVAKFVDLKKVGEAVTGTLVSAFEAVGTVVTAVGDAASTILGGIATGIGRAAAGLGGLIGGLTGLLTGGSKKYGEITHWLSLLREINQNALNSINHIVVKTDYIAGITQNAISQKTGKMMELLDGRISNRLELIKNWTKTTGQRLSNTNVILQHQAVQLDKINASVKGVINAIKNISGAQKGIVSFQPQLIMTHGTPLAPEITVPSPMLGRIAGGRPVEINITNEVILQGNVITDREYARERIIPEIYKALDVNADHIRRRFKEYLDI